MSEKNGNGNEFIRNKDYFELKDGVYFTVDALAKKYDTATNTVYKKAKEHSIAMDRVLGVTCFKDDIRFEKQTRQNGDPTRMRQIISYPELHDKVAEAIAQMFAARVEAGSNLNIITQKLQGLDRLESIVLDQNDLLKQILDHLTKENKQ